MKKLDLSAFLFLFLSLRLFAQPEFLDNSFGAAGRQTLRLPADDQVYNLFIQPDGKIIAAGTSFEGETYRYSLVRYLPDGSLDPAFGLNGKNHRLLPDDISGSADAVALQSNGNIVVLGSSDELIRYLPNGHPDPLFANPLELDFLDSYYGLAVGPGDKILLTGHLWASPKSFAIARLLPNGTLDMTFADGGVLALDFGPGSAYAGDVAVQPDGKIVACGNYWPPAGSIESDLIVVRLNPDGTLDNSFSMDGRLLIDGDSAALSARTLMLRPDGKIVVGAYGAGITGFTALFRFNPDGTPDDNFGPGGEVRVDDFYSTYHFAQASDGSIFVAGGQYGSGDVILKFTASGALDTGFGNAGTLHPALTPYRIAVKGDSTIVVASTLENDFALTSYLSDGNIAPAFNNGAVVVTNIGQSGGAFHKLALQPDGKILAGGSNLDDQVAIVRLAHDGLPDNGFRARIWEGAGDGYSLEALALQPDGKVLAASNYTFLDSQVGFLYRLLPDGALDSSFLISAFGPVVALALQPDGKILTTDLRKSGFFAWVSSLHRYHADGTPDLSFGINGSVDSKPYRWDHLALQADGKVLVAGTNTVFRYRNDGAPDSTFGINGGIQVPGGNEFLALLPDGKFLLAANTSTDVEISRYLENGSTDAGFGTAGKKLLPLGDGGKIHAMGVQPDGKILLAGEITDDQGGADFLLVRLLPDGSPDSSAGSGGFVTTNFEGLFADDHAYALAVQPDGKIILSGISFIATGTSAYTVFSLARYRADLTVESKEVYGQRIYPLKITPNPVTDFLHLQLPETAANAPADVQVFDTQGRMLMQRTLSGGQAPDVRSLAPGMYALRVMLGGRVYVGRLVKQ